VLEESARRTPDAVALVCGGSRRSYGSLDAEADRFADALVARGVAAGDRVAVCLDNSEEAVVAFFGVLKAGAVIVLVNPTTKGDKLARIIEDSGAGTLVVSGKKFEGVAQAVLALPGLRAILLAGASPPASALAGPEVLHWKDLVANREAVRREKRVQESDLACLLYTSGTTGVPKGVMHTHGSLWSATRSIATYLEATAADVVLSVLPLSFGYGLTQLLPTMLVGGRLVLERSFAFPQVVLQKLAGERCTGFAMVPTIATLLLQNNLANFDLSSLRYVTNAGAGIPPELLKDLRRRLPWVRIFPMYGQTECIRASFLPPEEVDRNPTSVGKGIPDQEMWIVDERGIPLPPGSTGELVVRGPHLMRGYWNHPEATARKLRPGPRPGEKVLHTGDLFRVDEQGWFYFVSRQDDIIKTRGEKVSPREVENVLMVLEGVLAAAVIGVPDAVLGEAVKAFVVRKSGAEVDAAAVLRHCARHLEEFAIPKGVEFLEELPQTPNSKVDRKALRMRSEPS